jgi:hypothetical protein
MIVQVMIFFIAVCVSVLPISNVIYINIAIAVLQKGALPGLIMLELRRLCYATMQMLWIEHLIN